MDVKCQIQGWRGCATERAMDGAEISLDAHPLERYVYDVY
jgi:hypothetical protein